MSKKLGQKGEDLACNYLISKGFQILERNFRHKRFEIDLIVKHENTIVFVEVKLRSSLNFGNPEDFVSQKQQNRIIEAANFYLSEKNIDSEIRFDIIAISNLQKPEIEHFEDAFY
ncbi:MAG: YraN family protein [Bacteroidetes bacterium]|nr:MAG: YraN family protein [Bacteroidota bacterium]